MTDKPTCGNCPHRKVFADDGSVGCKMSDTYLPLQAEALIEYVGCLSHPDAKTYLMKDVIAYMEQFLVSNENTPFDRYEWCDRAKSAMAKEAISLIRDGVKK